MSVERLLDSLLAAAADALPALLEAEWDAQDAADATDGRYIPLLLPSAYLFGRRLPDVIDGAVVMAWEEGTDIVAEGAGSHTAGPDPLVWTEQAHTLVLAAILSGDDEEVLERQLARYRRALLAFVRARQVTLLDNGQRYVVTVHRLARESRAAGVKHIQPRERGLFVDLVATCLEDGQ